MLPEHEPEVEDVDMGLMESDEVSDTTPMLAEDEETGAGGAQKAAPPQMLFCGCLSIQYYQPFFDVDTEQVQARLLRAMIPRKQTAQTVPWSQLVGPVPDAYGPFWIATTLVFLIAAVSNLSRWMSMPDESNFEMLVSATTYTYGYTVGAPVMAAVVCYYFGIPLGLPALLNIYGYSMAVFVPGVLIMVVPVDIVDWVVVLACAAWSLLFLATNLASTVMQAAPHSAVGVLGCFAGLHLVWSILLKWLFFMSQELPDV